MKTTPKDFFLHLGATVTLYTVIGALISLSFSIINYYFPDVLAGSFYANSVAWPISLLVVLVPTLYVIEWYIEKDIKSNQDKKELWVRRWRIFVTMFLTVALIVGDLITLINTYLNGEISARFVYKVLVILVISASVLMYYFFSLNEDMKWSKCSKNTIPWFGILISLIAIITGFVIVGSPTKQRNIRFDNQRIGDLQNIQWQVVGYWQQKNKLPGNLDALIDPISGTSIPNDPETKLPYKYTVTNNNSFKICASFALPVQNTDGRGEYYGSSRYDIAMSYPSFGVDENWKHEAGETCFDRKIDPEKYPQIKSYRE